MNRSTFPSQNSLLTNNLLTQNNGLAKVPSVNAMFSYSILGIAVFFGLACAIGGINNPPSTSTSTQQASALTRF